MDPNPHRAPPTVSGAIVIRQRHSWQQTITLKAKESEQLPDEARSIPAMRRNKAAWKHNSPKPSPAGKRHRGSQRSRRQKMREKTADRKAATVFDTDRRSSRKKKQSCLPGPKKHRFRQTVKESSRGERTNSAGSVFPTPPWFHAVSTHASGFNEPSKYRP